MTEVELEQILERLRSRRIFDEIFVIVVERNEGDIKLLDYGMKEIGDIAAWLAVQKQSNQQKEQSE